MTKLIKKDEHGFKIGKWYSPISLTWRNNQILRWYGVRFFDKYNEICFGRLTIRILKPKFLQVDSGIYLFREMPYDKDRTI